MAARVAMYKTLRTAGRPPWIWRLPRKWPLSRLKGATPTKATIFLRSRVPNSGTEEYEQNLEENIRQLVERLKRKSYRAKLVRRQYIPKGEGKLRPLGIPFHRDPPSSKSRFDFVGFEFYWGKDRGGRPHLERQTSRKKLRASLNRFTLWCKQNRNLRLETLFRKLNAKLRGYYNYYGVIGNSASLNQFFRQAMSRLTFTWNNHGL